MNHSQLRAFHAVAKQGSFTRAAATLRVSQPTLSGHVGMLEESYGVKLFQRSRRNVETTEFGRALLEITERYFASEAEAQRMLSGAKGLIKGRLRVAADSPYYIIPFLAIFSQRYAAVRKTISFGNSEHVLAALFAHHADIGILPELGKDERLHAVAFHPDRLVMVVNLGHPWAQRRSIKLNEITDQTLLLRERGSTTRALFEAALQAQNIAVDDVLEIGSREAIREAVAAGLGIGVVSEGEFGHDSRIHKLLISDAKLRVVEYAACLQERKQEPSVAAFMQMVAELATA